MRNFNIFGVHRKFDLGGGECLNWGLGQFAYLRGAWQDVGAVFEGS